VSSSKRFLEGFLERFMQAVRIYSSSIESLLFGYQLALLEPEEAPPPPPLTILQPMAL
jgi:hypothetical protein